MVVALVLVGAVALAAFVETVLLGRDLDRIRRDVERIKAHVW